MSEPWAIHALWFPTSTRLFTTTADVGFPHAGLPPSCLLPAAPFWVPHRPLLPSARSLPLLQILAALPYDWRGTHLLVYSCLRVVFIPLFIMCVYPNGQPAFGHPAWPCVFSLLMGITNGYFGSVPMILAAGKVSPEQRELAGRAAPSMGCHAGQPRRVTPSVPLCREHHDRVLHDGLDAGLSRGLFCLQPHQYVPQ